MSIKSPGSLASKVGRRVSLGKVLVIPFALQIFAAVSLIGWLSLRNGQTAVNDVATQLRSELTARIEQQLKAYFTTPHDLNQLNSGGFAQGDFDFVNASSAAGFLQQAKISPFVFGIYCAQQTDGGFIGVTRTDDNSELQLYTRNPSTRGRLNLYRMDARGQRTSLAKVGRIYDPRIRPWYKAALRARQATWSEVYLDFTTLLPTITASQPIYNKTDGGISGVCATDVTLPEDFRQFLSSLQIGKSGLAFVIDRSGQIISSSTNEPLTVGKGDQAKLLQATQSLEPLIGDTARQLQQQFGGFDKIQRAQQLDFTLSGQRQFVQVLPFEDGRGLSWLIVVVVPEADFMARINANTYTTILLCLAALGLATGLGIFTAGLITRPVLRLNAASQAISQGDLEQRVEVQAIDELGTLAQSFNQMAQQLQESFTALEAKNSELQHLDQLKDQFLANTSHELRTPLNGMIGVAESLIDGVTGPLPPQTCANLAIVVSSGRRLAHLIDDILDFAKLKHQNIELKLGPVAIRAIAEMVLTLSQPLIGQKQVQLANTIPPDLPLAKADENRVQQILYNLVGNAIKFTDQGSIKISAEAVDRYLVITVADTGIGIPAEKVDRIFESFEQADGSTARLYGGTGLGLAITRKLVELQGGEIYVDSTLDVGSRFTFSLPIFEGEIGEIDQPHPASQLSRQSLVTRPQSWELGRSEPLPLPTDLASLRSEITKGQAKILIVDDEPVNRQVLINYLSPRNYIVTQAADGIEALRLIEQGLHPDLILLDLMMPRLSGYEVIQKLRETRQLDELPIVLLTAKNQVSDLVTGLEAGANDYLTKPIEKDELLARIKTHIRLKQLKVENLRMRAELDVTRRLQQMLLPKQEELSQITELEIAGFMEPADEVGGDYYDVLQHKGKIKIGIGDVTGHGLESGVLMIMAQTAVRALLASDETDSTKFLDVLNRTIYGNVQRMNSDKNMTLALMDYEQGVLSLSGQHEEMIVVRAGGRIEKFDTIDLGFPIGLEEDIAEFVAQTQVQLNPGDIVALYTDGITEAENLEGERYGLAQLCEIISCHWQRSASEIRQAAIDDLRQHIGQQKIYDDVALLILKQK